MERRRAVRPRALIVERAFALIDVIPGRFSSPRSAADNFNRGDRFGLTFTLTLRSRNRSARKERTDHNRSVGALEWTHL
jgi:hypothetical protein